MIFWDSDADDSLIQTGWWWFLFSPTTTLQKQGPKKKKTTHCSWTTQALLQVLVAHSFMRHKNWLNFEPKIQLEIVRIDVNRFSDFEFPALFHRLSDSSPEFENVNKPLKLKFGDWNGVFWSEWMTGTWDQAWLETFSFYLWNKSRWSANSSYVIQSGQNW